MFDFRYHALSLAAVFLALMIGLLLGVAIGDKGLVSSAGEDVRSSLRTDVRQAQTRVAELRDELEERDQFENEAYPLLVEGRLPGARVGIVGLNGVSDGTIRNVRDALQDTGGRLTAVAVLRQPLPTDAIPPAGGTPAAGGEPDPEAVEQFGERVGAGFARGGRFIRNVRRSLLESFSGDLNGLDAVVLVRNPPQDAAAGERRTIDAFEDGLVTGMTDSDIPVVGVETSETDPSQIPWYEDHNLSSVDNIDERAGQVALVFALAGANGTFGTKSTAEALLPKTPGGVGG